MGAFVFFILFLGLPSYQSQEGEDDSHRSQDALTPQQMHLIHGKSDTNSDGRVSLTEFMEYSNKMKVKIASKDISSVLEEMDINKDGKLDIEEVKKDMEQWGETSEDDKREAEKKWTLESKKFKLADRNNNGFLEVSEIPALFYPETNEGVLRLTSEATLHEKDSNKDGELTPKEFWGGDVADGEEASISDEEHGDFNTLDKDRNGKLNLDELTVWESGEYHTQEAMKKLFEIADTNQDMHLTAEEMKAAREQIAGSDAQYHLMEWVEHEEF